MVVVQVQVDSSVFLEDHRLQEVDAIYLYVDHLPDGVLNHVIAFDVGDWLHLAPASTRLPVKLDGGDMIRPEDMLPLDPILGFFSQFSDHPPQMR